jgi:amino acid adenylation domain-containing protein
MRAKLLRLSEDNYVLVLNFHHIIFDGSSIVVLYRELTALYCAFLDGKPSPLQPLEIQYGDYAVWQDNWLRSEALDAQLGYWKRQLGTGSVLNLPTDYTRRPVHTYLGAKRVVSLSDELTKALKHLSRQENATLFMMLLAAFDILLSRYSGQQDIVIGSTMAGRGRHETDGLIGFFINAIALRCDLSGNPTFIELLERVRDVCLEAYAHQDLPFDKLVEELAPPRDFTRNPIFDVLFNMADTSERVFSLTNCEVTKISHVEPGAKFDIVLHAPEVNGKTELAIVYNAGLFSEQRINILLQQFESLLCQITEEPKKAIAKFSLVIPGAESSVLDPSEPLDDTWEKAIHELFSERAQSAPEKLAVVDSDNSWTYRELDHQSSQLANYLITNGIRPQDTVAIYAHRSSALVLALLGVLKAGAAFVILDPAYPGARLIAYLRIARPKGWIKMHAAGELPEELAACVEALNASCRLSLRNDKQALAEFFGPQPDISPSVIVGANEPAYIAFTSGSTGEPKGVLGRHGPITHFLPWQKEAFALNETDSFCLLSGLAYNHLHRDVFTPLALGATLYVPPEAIVREPERLTDWLRANAISVLHLTPPLGQLLLTARNQPLPAVRRVLFGGDVLTKSDIANIRLVVPNAKIGNFYGATETQRAVGYYEIPDDLRTENGDANRQIPLGRGIRDVQLLLLNSAGLLAGVGELAELYVRSPHLAEGYIGDENLTNEKFIPNPFTSDPNDRLYRTGELGRYLPNGNVEWAGRNDRRVNIRGFRVELEEIESVLKQHPIVKNAAVVLQDVEASSWENSQPETGNPKLNQRLIAYIAADELGDSVADLLHAYTSTRLPDYMVPADFVIVGQLPLSPNGKVDYRALPTVQPFLAADSSANISPGNEVEAKLSAIFSQVLGREQIGIDENFFRLGGHSLLAAQAAARIREAFGVGLELRTFLEFPTVAALAKQIHVRIKTAGTTPIDDGMDREEIEL